MDYQDLVRDFATRTRHNLEFIRQAQRDQPGSVYEVTQLINSLLGLLVFPQQSYINSIPAKTLAELQQEGWPVPEIVGDYPQVEDLNQLVRYLRNAVAHFNIKFKADEQQQICGLEVWNRRGPTKTWHAIVTLDQLERLVDRFLALLLEPTPLPNRQRANEQPSLFD